MGAYSDLNVAISEIPNPEVSGQPKQPHAEILEIGDLLIAYLKQLSIKYVFGVPGGAIEPLYNALARQARYDEENGIPENERGPRAIIARHETDAAFMAEGYARASGKMGVCCTTTGPGATNIITGIASAYQNRVPMLVITAQTALVTFGRNALQESSCTGVDIVGMFRYCTRYNTLISHKEQFEHKLSAAILSARQSPAGPAHLSIPLDIMRSASPVSTPTYQLTSNRLANPVYQVETTVDRIFKHLNEAEKITFVIGHGCPDAIGIILKVAEIIDAKIIVTPHSKGLVSPFHPLFRGVFGFAGHESANDALNSADKIIAICVMISELSSNGCDHLSLLSSKLIHIDDNEENFIRSPIASTHLLTNVTEMFSCLLENCQHTLHRELTTNNTHSFHGWKRQNRAITHFTLNDEKSFNSNASPIKPQRLMRDLPRLLPPNTRYVADTGNSIAWSLHYLHLDDHWQMEGPQKIHNNKYDACIEFTSMGWAIGAAIGIALGANKPLPNNISCEKQAGKTPIVCITGDGSLLMAGQEITVAIQEKLPIIFVILNDSALGMVKHGQQLARAEAIGYKLPEIDFCKFARVLGAHGERVFSPEDLAAINFKELLDRPGPTLIDVRIDAEEVPPIASRMKVLQEA